MRGSDNVTSRQMALFIFIAQTAIGITMLPSVLANQVGHDGWLSVIIAGFISTIAGVLVVMLLNRYSNKGIYEITQLLFGRFAGGLVNILLMIYIIIAAAISVRIFSLFLRITLFPRTPPVVMSTFILLPSVYLVWQGLKNVCRFKYITVISYLSLVMYMALIADKIRPTFLMPIGEAGAASIFNSVGKTFVAFVGVELVAFLYPAITDKKKTMKWIIAANAASTLFLALVVAVSTAVFGENLLKIFSIPLFNLARVYHAPVLERLDLYFAGLWFIVMGCAMRAYMYTGFYSLQEVAKLKKSKLMIVLFFALLILLSRIPRDINDVFVYFERVSQIGIGVILFLILCLGLSYIIRKGVKSFENT